MLGVSSYATGFVCGDGIDMAAPAKPIGIDPGTDRRRLLA
jgi:hypothetical protein